MSGLLPGLEEIAAQGGATGGGWMSSIQSGLGSIAKSGAITPQGVGGFSWEQIGSGFQSGGTPRTKQSDYIFPEAIDARMTGEAKAADIASQYEYENLVAGINNFNAAARARDAVNRHNAAERLRVDKANAAKNKKAANKVAKMVTKKMTPYMEEGLASLSRRGRLNELAASQLEQVISGMGGMSASLGGNGGSSKLPSTSFIRRRQ